MIFELCFPQISHAIFIIGVGGFLRGGREEEGGCPKKSAFGVPAHVGPPPDLVHLNLPVVLEHQVP